jgi:predicted HTH domain antitoxin
MNILEKEAKALIKRGIYKDEKSLFEDALRALLVSKPGLRVEAAIELYKAKEISLKKAAEIASLDIESFKDELSRRGLKIELEPPSKDILDKGVSLLLK